MDLLTAVITIFVLASAVSGQCDPFAPPKVLRAWTGSVSVPMSPFGFYFNDLDCRFEVKCPSSSAVIAVDFAVALAAGDNFTITDTLSGSTIWAVRGFQSLKTMLSTSSIFVRFYSDSEFADRGLTRNAFYCYTAPCASTNSSLPTPVLGSGLPRLVETTFANERCQWVLTCPSAESDVIWFDELQLGSTSRVFNMATNETLNALSIASSTNLSRVAVDFAAQSWSSVVRLRFVCTSMSATERRACYGTGVHADIGDAGRPSVAWSAPTTKTSIAGVFTYINCSWTVACQPSQLVAINMRLFLAEPYGDGLWLFDIDNGPEGTPGAQLLGKYVARPYSGVLGVTTYAMLLRNTSRAALRLNTGWFDVKLDDRLFETTVECFNTICTYGDLSLPVKPVSEGVEVKTRFGGESCAFSLRCANASHWIVPITVRVDEATLTITNGSGFVYKTFREGVPFREAELNIAFAARSPQETLSFKYGCMEPLIGVCEPGDVYNFTYGDHGDGPLVAPFPRSSTTGHYYNGMRCVNRLSCAGRGAGPLQAMRVRGMIRTLNQMDNLTLYITAGGRQPNLGDTPIAAYFSENGAGDQDGANVGFDTVIRTADLWAVFHTDALGTHVGFVSPLTFECLVAPCTTNTTEPVVLYSAGPNNVQELSHGIAGEYCHFIFRCTNTSLGIYFLELSGLKVTYMNGSALPRPVSPGQATSYNELLATLDSPVSSPTRAMAKFECVDYRQLLFCNPQRPFTVRGYSGVMRIPTYRSRYLQDLDCIWNIQCADSRMNVAVSGAFFANDDGDRLQLYNHTGGLLHQVGGQSGEDPFEIKHMLRGPRNTVRFVTDATGFAFGFTQELQFSCYASNCSTNRTGVIHLTHNRSTPPVEVGIKWYGEECSFVLSCPFSQDWHAFTAVSDLRHVSFTDASGRPAPSPKTSYMQNIVPLHVNYLSVSLSYLWSFRFACFISDEFLMSPCGYNVTAPLSAFNGTFDVFQTPFGDYFNDLSCRWIVTCPLNMNIAMTGLVTTAGEPDSLVVTALDGSVLSRTFGYAVVDPRDPLGGVADITPKMLARVYRHNVVRVNFSSDVRDTGPGLGVVYRCISGNCSSNRTTPTVHRYFRDAPVLYMGNTHDNEDCGYELFCNETTQWMVFLQLKDLAGTVVMRDVDGDIIPILPTSTPVPMSYLSLDYTSPWGNQEHRFSVGYQCFDPFGSFAACIPGGSLEVTWGRGSLQLPMTPIGKYGTNLMCTWDFVCPSPENGILLVGEIQTYNESDKLVVIDPSDGSVWLERFTHNRSYSVSWRLLVPRPTATARFVSNENGGAPGLLRPFTFACMPTRCSSVHAPGPVKHSGQPNDPSVTVTSDADNDQCEWLTDCSTSTFNGRRTCLIFHAFSNVSLATFVSATGTPIVYDHVKPIVITTQQLRVVYRQPQHGTVFWFNFSCVPEPETDFCSDSDTRDARRLWVTYTEAATETGTLIATDSHTASGTIPATATWEIVPTSTHSATASVTATRTVTPPPTPTQSKSVSLSLGTDSGTSTAHITASMSVSGSFATQTADHSVTTTASRSVSESPPRRITLVVEPSAIAASAIRGSDRGVGNRRLVFTAIGSSFNEWLPGSSSQHAAANTRFEARRSDGRSEMQPRGFISRVGRLWIADAISVNASHFIVELPVDNGFFITVNETIVVRLHRHAFRFGELGPEPVISATAFTIVQDTPPRQVSRLETAAVSAAAIGGLFGAAATATQAARVSLLQRLAACEFPEDEPLQWSQYPIGVPIGGDDDPLRYYNGAFILNLALVLGIGLVHLLIAALIAAFHRGTPSIREAQAAVLWPSFESVPILFLLQDTLSAHWLIATESSSALMQAFAIVLVVFPWFAALLWLARLLCVDTRRFYAWFADFAVRTRLSTFLNGKGEWVDALTTPGVSNGFVKRYGMYFSAYRERRHAFLLVEIGLVVALSVVGALQPYGDCTLLRWVTAALLAGYVLVLGALVPYCAVFEQCIQFLIALLEAAAVVMMAASSSHVEHSSEWERYMRMCDILLICSMVVINAKTAIDVLLLVLEYHSAVADLVEAKVSEQNAPSDAREGSSRGVGTTSNVGKNSSSSGSSSGGASRTQQVMALVAATKRPRQEKRSPQAPTTHAELVASVLTRLRAARGQQRSAVPHANPLPPAAAAALVTPVVETLEEPLLSEGATFQSGQPPLPWFIAATVTDVTQEDVANTFSSGSEVDDPDL